MTEDAERCAKALVLLEYEEIKQALARKEEIAKRWGTTLEAIGKKLAYHSSDLCFAGESVPAPLGRSANLETLDPQCLNPEKIKALRDEIQELRKSVAQLEKRKGDIGFASH